LGAAVIYNKDKAWDDHVRIRIITQLSIFKKNVCLNDFSCLN
jgi:hypothetical protein